jgi:single-strand DNA-binding protein
MADGLNKVMLLGRLSKDPELRFTQGGTAILELSLATSESWFDQKTQERKERTEWHKIVVWGARAEGLAKILKKGDGIFVEGSLRTESWEKNGEKRYAVKIHAINVLLTGGKGNGGGGGGGAGAPQKAAAPEPAGVYGPDDVPYLSSDMTHDLRRCGL